MYFAHVIEITKVTRSVVAFYFIDTLHTKLCCSYKEYYI